MAAIIEEIFESFGADKNSMDIVKKIALCKECGYIPIDISQCDCCKIRNTVKFIIDENDGEIRFKYGESEPRGALFDINAERNKFALSHGAIRFVGDLLRFEVQEGCFSYRLCVEMEYNGHEVNEFTVRSLRPVTLEYCKGVVDL